MDSQTATILHVEIPGFEDLSANFSSDGFNSFLKEYYKITENAILLHQGEMSNFSGETFLVVFIPDKSNSSLQALEAVHDFRERFKEFLADKKLSGSAEIKAGISTGNTIIGEVAAGDKKQLTVMGQAVNYTKRLCEFAEKGQILVDEKVQDKTSGQFIFQKLEPLPIRGTKEMLSVYLVTGKKRKKIQAGSFSKRQINSEMVGRSREVEQLESLFKQLISGKGSIVNIVGKAGIGKSRLMAEMKAQPLLEKVLLLEGRAVSTGQNLSFHPITNLIKSWAGITEDDLPSASSEKLYQGIKRNTPEQADEIYAFLATMMGLPLEGKYKERVKGIEGEALEKLILKNLRDLIIAATKDKPRIYLVEDMHWADSSSITLFESLYKLSQNYPVMFINVMRPGYKETGDYILKYLVDKFPGDHTTININPLEEKESDNLIKNLLRETPLPVEIQKMIIRKTEGNPFFIEEIIRSFIDEGIIEVKDGHFIVTEKIKEANIPETINEAILSRVDKLDEKTRELLNTASVMGRNFYYKVLEEATDTIEELDDRLAYLSEVQLITETKKKEEIEYLFKHALAQQLTYESMIHQARKDTHLKIAKSIEKVFADNINEYYSTLVHHYKMAEDEEKTIHYLLLAGDEAIKSGASTEALNFYENSLQLISEGKMLGDPESLIKDIEIKVANLYRVTGRNLEAADRFRKLISKYTKHYFSKNEKFIKYRGLFSLLVFYIIVRNEKFFFKRQMYDGFEACNKMIYGLGMSLITMSPKHFALEIPPIMAKFCLYDFRNSLEALRVYLTSSALFLMTGLSFKTSQKIIDFIEDAGIHNDPYGYITLKMIKAMQNYYTGNWFIEEDQNELIKQGIRIGSFWDTEIYITYRGFIHVDLGNYKEFIFLRDKLMFMAESLNDSHSGSQAYRLSARGYYKFRKFDELLAIAEEGDNYIEKTENSAIILYYNSIKALLYYHLKDTKKKEVAMSKAEKWKDKVSNMPVYHTQYLLAKVTIDFDTLIKSSKNDSGYGKMLKEIKNNTNGLIAQSKKNVATLTEAYLLKARINIFLRNKRQAFNNLRLAIKTGEKHHANPDLSRAYFETGKFLSDPKTKQKQLNGLSGKDYLEKAKVMFEEMDLQWDLEEYRKFLDNAKT